MAVVHQEVSAQGPRRVVVHAAGAVGHVAHHHRLRLREPAGRHSGEGGTPMAPTRPTSSPPRAGVPVPSPARSPRCRVAAPGGPRAAAEPLAVLRRGRALATLRDVNMIKLESGNPPLQLGKAVCNSADYPLVK